VTSILRQNIKPAFNTVVLKRKYFEGKRILFKVISPHFSGFVRRRKENSSID